MSHTGAPVMFDIDHVNFISAGQEQCFQFSVFFKLLLMVAAILGEKISSSDIYQHFYDF